MQTSTECSMRSPAADHLFKHEELRTFHRDGHPGFSDSPARTHCICYGAAWRAAKPLIEENRQLRKDLDHWKANHADMVARNRFLRTRPDLPTERLQHYDRMVADVEDRAVRAETVLRNLQAGIRRHRDEINKREWEYPPMRKPRPVPLQADLDLYSLLDERY